MISAECVKICDEAARAFGFSEHVRREDRNSLEHLLERTTEISKKLNLQRTSEAAISIESGRNQHKYIVQMDFSLLPGTMSPSVSLLKTDFRNVRISNDGRVAILDDVKFCEKDNLFTCKFEVPSLHSNVPSVRLTTISNKKTNKSPIPNISKVTAPTYATRQKGTKERRVEKPIRVVEIKKTSKNNDDDDDNEENIEDATADSESTVDESKLTESNTASTNPTELKKRSWWWPFSKSGTQKLTEEEAETIRALEYDAKLFEKK